MTCLDKVQEFAIAERPLFHRVRRELLLAGDVTEVVASGSWGNMEELGRTEYKG